MDRLANEGVRYTNFHSTSLCSPTRAAIITGRNHHSVGFGVVGEIATGFPGYVAYPFSFRIVPIVPLSIGMMESAWAKMANMAKTVSGNLAKVAKDTKTATYCYFLT
jgi:hypothetical protein